MILDMEVPADNCEVCLIEHDAEIHAATLSIHGWLRSQVVKWIGETSPEETALEETAA